jgi:hypothetical protein
MVRLMTGETLIAGIGKSGKNSYILEKPMVMALVTVQQQSDSMPVQEVNVMLKNWIDFAAEDYIVVRKDIVMCVVRPIRGIVSDYTQARINSDIIDDMGSGSGTVDALKDSIDPDEDTDTMEPKDEMPDDGEGRNGYDEFPGWGGDPKL